ncbi:MAG: hypothetical protein NW215_00685 [Hyphomicrobiales bacterium]|nr:hypothetical protein [Hyphomicrobiales bacterium]
MESVAALLGRIGPSLTTELIAEFAKRGVSSTSARQRIARANDTIKRLAGLRFPYNARFLYLPDQFGDAVYWNALERVFQDHGKSYWSAVTGLKARGGCFPKKHFASVCGTPAARKRQLSPQRVLERLIAINLMEEFVDEATNQTFVRFKPAHYRSERVEIVRARMIAENVVLHGMKDWCRRTGFGSFDRVRIRDDDETPVVSSIAWDMSAPCYARPLVKATTSAAKPGFVVCDVNLRNALSENDVALFVRKHDLASAPQNVPPIMPFLIADGFAPTAFSLAKTKGVLATTTGQLFGEDVAKALRDLIGLLSDTGRTASVKPEHIERVLTSLTKIEGAANNLRGALFEFVVGALVKGVEGGYLRAGDKWRNIDGRSAEIDVLLDRPDDKGVLIIECKSKIPGARVNLQEVQKWHGDRIPLLYSILQTDSRLQGKQFTFEIWSNGPFADDAIEWLKTQPEPQPNVNFHWKDGDALKKYANRTNNAAIRKALNEHYFRHPLANANAQSTNR